MDEQEIISTLGKLIIFKSDLGLAFFPEEFLPASKDKIKEILLTQIQLGNDMDGACSSGLTALKDFIPFEEALEVCKEQLELYSLSSEKDQKEAMKKTEKLLKALRKYSQ